MAENTEFSASRRAFLKLPSKPKVNIIRPPWTDAQSVTDCCTSCGKCVDACPEKILLSGSDGKPMVVFDGRECTFCQKCAEVCDDDVFDITRVPAWGLKVELKSGCLQEHGISCQVCRDNCPASAIKVDLTKRPFGQIRIDLDACTGCGACLSTCPQEVLAFNDWSDRKEVA